MKKIILKNKNFEKKFFYSLKESKKSKKIKMQIVDKENIVIILPKKTFLNSFSLNIFSPENFIEKNKNWIFKNSEKFSKNKKIPLSINNWKNKKLEFLEIAKERVEFFNDFYNFKYKNIFVKDTKSRWGSCSSVGNLNFNYRIFLLKPEERDYVIVHELCHLKEMNHSGKFWDLVEKKSPEYKNIRRDLKKYHFDIS